MLLPIMAVILGLIILAWSADTLVDGASALAALAGLSPLLIGMLIVGFGTSAPEMLVSAVASAQGNPGLALGNALGSNISNIALILGVAALISPIVVHSKILRRELPVLSGVTLLAVVLMLDGALSRIDAVILLFVFGVLMVWSIRQGKNERKDTFGREMHKEIQSHPLSLKSAVMRVVVGILLLVGSSRALVWGSMKIAMALGVSDLIIGLTIVALGTSLPELASSIAAVRKREHDLALGNVLGSNLFNTLAVVGLAALIKPFSVAPEVLTRDCTVMLLLTLSLFLFGTGFGKKQGQINRWEAALLLCVYLFYIALLAWSEVF